jgi:replicative DNA helicase
VVSLTGNGKHLWFKHPGGILKGDIRIYPGIDIRADGNQIVAPPSIHKTGKRYRFNRPLSVSVVERLPLFPTALFVKDVQNSQTLTPAKVGNPKGWISDALEAMTNGNIDDTLFKVCSRLRNDGYTEEDCRVLLLGHALRAGATEGHLEDKIRNVWERYEPKTAKRTQYVMGGLQSNLVLHSPSNPDSLNEFRKRTMDESASKNLSTGYRQFDALSKGLKKGEVLTVAARTGVGKTNWIITPCRTFCESGKKVLLFSTEMSFDQIWQRYTATLRQPGEFAQHAFTICDEFTPNIERIEEAIKNVMPDLFVFDHISHIGTDYHIISKFMSEIKRLSRLFNIPAIVTAQLNRNADYVDQGQRVEPRLSMIQGSDQIGQMSAQVLLLNEKRIVDGVTEIEGIVVKNRHGDKGLVQFGLVKNPYRMIEL